MDQQAATGTSYTDGAIGNQSTELTATHLNASVETVPPSEGSDVGASVESTPKPLLESSVQADATDIGNVDEEPSVISARNEAVPENISVAQPGTGCALQPTDASTIPTAINTEANPSNYDENTPEEGVQLMDNNLTSGAVAANMEIEVDQLQNTNGQPQIEADGISLEELAQNNNENEDENNEDIRFDPSPLIEPLLEDDEMGEQGVDDDDDDDQPIGDYEGEDNLMLEDISDDASTSPDAVFDDDQMRAAFSEMLVQNRRGGENFMQRLRSAFFTMEHNRERRRHETETNEVEVEEPEPENPVSFDTSLPAEHSYLGENMDRVSGVHYLEVGQQYNLMLFMHQHILFPGEVLPFMISGSIIESDMSAQNGLLFGVCFPTLCNSEEIDDNFYGVTCQIYEKGTDERGNTLIKSRALQRFVTKGSQVTGPLSFIAAHPQFKVYGKVRILPEIYLREPLQCIDMGSLNRFRDINSMRETYKRYQAATTAWPAHIYDYYSITAIVEKARSQLAQHKIDTMPTDPTQLSFWLVRNLHLSDSLMKTIFLTDSVNIRMKLISDTFTDDSVFTCRYCGNRIANCQQLFAMSKHGVQTQYCNSAGYIHETNTVYQLLPDAITYSGQPSAKFSWFPGYEWHIIVCKICSRHIGWKFKALEPNLVPKSFFGISSSSVRISSPTPENTNSRAAVFQSLMRLVRREMQ
ncbi:protein cereblon [Zeugodacus cucurbitae]|uniref:protein cereblon n=1 Tax=Zeugodacus cucurbitae TaxID=28588 RepID=UPI0023D957AB|nr:protein cereblon [Zeugodacus cucurbitae]